MNDFHAARVRTHRRNIERHCRLLSTELTDHEREYLHKWVAEGHAQLERLEKREAEQQAGVVASAEEMDRVHSTLIATAYWAPREKKKALGGESG